MKDATYLSIPAGSAEAEHRARGSRFIAVTRAVSTMDEALEARDDERRRFHDATHHVFAARLASGETRADDDGEPTGTGGRPALRAIQATDVHDVVVVVTRYFGGTKLGTGGLGRAYGAAAAAAVGATPVRRMVSGRRLRVTHGYEDTGHVSRLLERLGAIRLDEWYAEAVVLEVALPDVSIAIFTRDLTELTAGRATVVTSGSGMLLPLDT